MATREQIKSWFQRGLRPTAAQFGAWIDSFVHVSDNIAKERVTGLAAALDAITSPGEDEACGKKEIEYKVQAVPVFKDVLDLSREYGEQVIKVSDGPFGIIRETQMGMAEVKAVIVNETSGRIDIGAALPTGVKSLRASLTVEAGDATAVTFVKCTDGNARYDPEDVELRVY